MKDGPKRSKTVPTVYSHIGILEIKSHAKDGIIYKGTRLIIPKSESASTLKVLHMGHYAVDKMSLRARETVYWPDISEDIRHTYHHCHICAKFARTQQRETLQFYRNTTNCLGTTGTRHLHIDKHTISPSNWLLQLSFLCVKQLHSLHSLSVIEHLKDIFTEIGIPWCIVSDGGTQFTSQEFRDFTRTWGIQHKVTSPTNAQSNGQAEHFLCKLQKTVSQKPWKEERIHT